MRYGDRLKTAMGMRAEALHRKISNSEVAIAAGVSRQNIGMVIKGTQGEDQKLGSEANYKVAAYLRVNPHWLATGEGDMLKGVAPTHFRTWACTTPPKVSETSKIAAIFFKLHPL